MTFTRSFVRSFVRSFGRPIGISLAILLAAGTLQVARAQVTEPGTDGTGTKKPVEAAPALKFGPELKAELLQKLDELIDNRCYAAGVDFTKWPEYKDKHKEDIEKAANPDQLAGALSKTLSEFGISHFRVQSPRVAAQRNKSSMVGVGVSLKPADDGLEIISIVPEGPAASAGLKAGEKIVMINGEKADRVEALRGDEGTTVEVRVRATDGHEEDFVLTRKTFSTLHRDSLIWVEDDAAVMKVNSFAVGYNRDRIAKFVQEASEKAHYLILDLRNNGGGSTTSLNHLLSHFMPANTNFGTSVSRSLAKRFAENQQGDSKDAVAIAQWATSKWKTRSKGIDNRFEGKIAVLINGASGSASEITAAALKELRSAVVVGSPSAGAVLVSTFVGLPGGYAVQIPLEDYVTIKGVRLEGHPIKPDIELASQTLAADAEPQEDPVIMRALAELKGHGDSAKNDAPAEAPAAKTEPAPEGESK